jgi:ubiquitin carboxyl-terminal hydrolase 8
VIYETEFKKSLKHIPVLLVGGLEAWKQDIGEEKIVKEGFKTDGTPSETRRSSPGVSDNMISRSTSSSNVPAFSQLPTATIADPHQMWTPPPRSDPNLGVKENGVSTYASRHAGARDASPSRFVMIFSNLGTLS